jgi:hypothetical protein
MTPRVRKVRVSTGPIAISEVGGMERIKLQHVIACAEIKEDPDVNYSINEQNDWKNVDIRKA